MPNVSGRCECFNKARQITVTEREPSVQQCTVSGLAIIGLDRCGMEHRIDQGLELLPECLKLKETRKICCGPESKGTPCARASMPPRAANKCYTDG